MKIGVPLLFFACFVACAGPVPSGRLAPLAHPPESDLEGRESVEANLVDSLRKDHSDPEALDDELAPTLGDVGVADNGLAFTKELVFNPQDERSFLAPQAGVMSEFVIGNAISEMSSMSGVRQLAIKESSELHGSVGVVLPLSGPYADFGNRSLEGILSAAGIFDLSLSRAGEGLTLEIRDSKGNPEVAARQVAELAENEDVRAILGPLLADETAAAIPVVRKTGIPLLALSRRELPASATNRMFRFGQTPRAEVELLVDYAVRMLGLTRFAILYPDDNYGKRIRKLFWQAVEARDAKVVGIASYPTDSTDFADSVRSLIGFRLMKPEDREILDERARLLAEAKRLPPESAMTLREEAKELTASDGEPLPPFVDFDALFIPDSHQVVALMAPQLAFHEISAVRLLGLNEWHHADLVSIGREHVDGAVFTGLVFNDSQDPFISRFTELFRGTFNRMPDAMAAQAFDAAALLFGSLGDPPADRQALATRILGMSIMAGASGKVRMLPDGNTVKRPHLLGVDRGRIISIDEQGEPPYLKMPLAEEVESDREEL